MPLLAFVELPDSSEVIKLRITAPHFPPRAKGNKEIKVTHESRGNNAPQPNSQKSESLTSPPQRATRRARDGPYLGPGSGGGGGGGGGVAVPMASPASGSHAGKHQRLSAARSPLCPLRPPRLGHWARASRGPARGEPPGTCNPLPARPTPRGSPGGPRAAVRAHANPWNLLPTPRGWDWPSCALKQKIQELGL